MELVVPHAGTWIEISDSFSQSMRIPVVPHAGTWIEICSPPHQGIFHPVVPHAGTWIEIIITFEYQKALKRRSPRGNVD